MVARAAIDTLGPRNVRYITSMRAGKTKIHIGNTTHQSEHQSKFQIVFGFHSTLQFEVSLYCPEICIDSWQCD